MDLDGYLRFVLALAFVLALIGLLTWLLRRFGLGGRIPVKMSGPKRLAIVEAMPLDGRRKLVLVRRDDTEHLIILGPSSELTVETGIPAEAAAKAKAGGAPGLGASVRKLAGNRRRRDKADDGGAAT